MATTAPPLIDRHFLEKLERLAIRWQKSFPGLVGGHNVSRFAGAGQEFLDHRNFHHGDDLRAVNWRAYMRLEQKHHQQMRQDPCLGHLRVLAWRSRQAKYAFHAFKRHLDPPSC